MPNELSFEEKSIEQTLPVLSLENKLFDSSQMTLTGFPVLRWHQTADIGAVPNPALPKVFMAVGEPFFARQFTLFIDL